MPTAVEILAESGPVAPAYRMPVMGAQQQVFAPTRGWTGDSPSCPATVYVQTGSDSFVAYGILGGP